MHSTGHTIVFRWMNHKMYLLLFSVSFLLFKRMNHNPKPSTDRSDWLLFFFFFKSITCCLIYLFGDQKREAPSAFCACSLCGETTAVYGFAEVVTARDGTSDTLPNKKGGSSGGQEKKKEGDDDVMEGGAGWKDSPLCLRQLDGGWKTKLQAAGTPVWEL